MKALTLWQPWASAIAFGPKRIENRRWRPAASRLPLRIAIHAGAKLDPAGFAFCAVRGLEFDQDTVPRSVILAVATVVAVVDASDDPWWMGPLGWVLEDVRRLRRPIPASGAQALWTPPPAVCRRLARL